MQTEVVDIPPVPPVTQAGFADPVWPRWLRLVRAKLATALTDMRVAAGNGFTGTVLKVDAATAEFTLSTTAQGILKGSGGALISAAQGTDYSLPVAVATSNGFSGDVSQGPSLATITLSTPLTGMLKGTGTSLAVATAGIDYTAPASYVSAISTANQTATANTRTPVTLSTLNFSRNFTQPTSSTLSPSTSGVYNVQFSLQLDNTATSVDDVLVWLVVNGTDLPASNSICTVPSKHGSTDGSAILAANVFVQLAPGDTVALYWATVSGTSSLKTVTPTGITAPVSPSVILTITQVYP